MRKTYRRAVASAGAIAFACAIGYLAPAAASAQCAQINELANNVQEFNGTASASYVSGTHTVTTISPDTETMSIDHSGTNLVLPDLTNLYSLNGGGAGSLDAFANENGPTGGTVTVNDSYSDNVGPDTSDQTGSGPTLSAGNTTSGEQGADDVYIDPSNCTYQFFLSYGIATTTTNIEGTPPDDPGVDDRVTTPTEPIPTNLVLQGSAALPIATDGASGAAGEYNLFYDTSWAQSFSEFGPDGPDGGTPFPGTATMSWKLTPTYNSPPPPPPPPTNTTHCVVPNVKGKTKSKAEKAIKKAGCKVGKVTKKHSKKVKKGKVISQSVKAGKKKPVGTKVKLVVSLGKAK